MMTDQRRPGERMALAASGDLPLSLYAATIFLSAFLLFQVEPMIAKMIVPWFGGSASVWTACLLFFQTTLLLGYLYAHWSTARLGAAVRGRVHVGLLLVSVVALPSLIALRSGSGGHWAPTGNEEPTGRILLVLLATIGLPYLLLSTTGPLLQAWAARLTRAGKSPYRLYALSNAGSLLALLGYPVLVEPTLTLRQQAVTWSVAYVAFVGLCGLIALRQPRAVEAPVEDDTPRGEVGSRRPGLGLHLSWVGLAAVPSVLLLAVTNHLSQNVAAIPFLWVLPLTLYLLSFIVCFGPSQWAWKPAFLPLPALAVGTMAYEYTQQFDTGDTSIQAIIAVFALGLFACCLLCHGELARLKPPPQFLTSFYLMMSLGGALGGVFVALIAPHVFSDYWEFPLAIGACALVALFVLYREPRRGWWYDWQWLTAAVLTALLLGFLANDVRDSIHSFKLTERSFYGVLRVKDPDDPTVAGATRTLTNGTINHGEQFVDPQRHMQPTTYYGPDSGVGLAIREAQTRGPVRVGVIGLGTGTVAGYGRPGDWFQFYDINPQVIRVAHTLFSFLRDSKATIPPVVLGDARLSLEREPSQQFDVLVVDAFAGDSIPIHLLTREAFALYFRHLKPGGVLVVHVTNLYLDLQPVVAMSAQAVGQESRLVETSEDDDADLAFTDWMLVTNRHALWDAPLLKNAAQPITSHRRVRLWTDDYSNLYQIVKTSPSE